jgi:hypothetical protein
MVVSVKLTLDVSLVIDELAKCAAVSASAGLSLMEMSFSKGMQS